MRRFLEAGRLNSPRGIKGEIRFDCWCDSFDFLEDVRFLYLDSEGRRRLEVKEYRPTVSTVTFKGYEDRDRAASLTGRIVYFDREDVALPDGCFYFDDMIGVGCFDSVSGERIGTVEAVDEGVACFYYRISGESNYYIPNVDAYVVVKDPEKGLFVKDYEGLRSEGKA